jgi:multidrug efflux pump subunit AcrB
MSISSDSLPERQANIEGATFPLPYGGRPREISVDLGPRAVYAEGISAEDVTKAINTHSLITPSGSVKIGPKEYGVKLCPSHGDLIHRVCHQATSA